MADIRNGEQFPRRLLEKQAKQILDRALELDHTNGPHMSLENLRTIAREIGISDEALETAMDETLRAGNTGAVTSAQTASADDRVAGQGWLSRWWGGRKESWSRGLGLLTRLSFPVGLAAGVIFSYFVREGVIDRDGAIILTGLSALWWALLLVVRPRRSTAAQIISLSLLYWLGFGTGGVLNAMLVHSSPRIAEMVVALTGWYFAVSVTAGVVITALIALINKLIPGSAVPPGGSVARTQGDTENSAESRARGDALNQLAVAAE